MTISASLVKELRDKTGAGMMDCKTALTEVKGDIEAAVDWLRKKGLSKAAKKAGRIAAEGLIGVHTTGNAGAMVEVNSETDFVARNEQFQDMVTKIAALAAEGEGRSRKAARHDLPGQEDDGRGPRQGDDRDHRREHDVRRTAALDGAEGRRRPYTCTARWCRGLGKIGVLVALASDSKNADELSALARQIAMHVAATNPVALDLAGVRPRDARAREGDPRRQEQGQAAAGAGEDRRERRARATPRTTASWISPISARCTSKTVTQVLKEAEGRSAPR